MGFFKDFKKFITKGNILDLAIAVVIGGAFNKIVTSFVNNIITPLIGLIVGKVDITELKVIIRPATEEIAELSLSYGIFLQALIDFLIVAFCIFTAIRIMTKVTTNAKKHIEETAEAIKKRLENASGADGKEEAAQDSKTAEVAAENAAEVVVATETVQAPLTAETLPSAEVTDLLKEIRDLLKTSK